jgi:hypoxanthine phosphoribosyltransferase
MGDILLYNYFDIYKLIYSVAKAIEDRLDEKDTNYFVILLNGGMIFAVDLLKYLQEFDIIYLPIKVTSYNNNIQTDSININDCGNDLSVVKDKNVFIIDDIFDTGKTINHVTEYLTKNFAPKQITSVCMFSRYSNPAPDVCGNILNHNKYIYGYGLDDNQHKRHIVSIYAIRAESN